MQISSQFPDHWPITLFNASISHSRGVLNTGIRIEMVMDRV